MGFTFTVPEIEDVEVLIVDDDHTSLGLIEAFVNRIGHPSRAYADPLEALMAIKERPPNILVTDLMMPQMSGVDLAIAAREVEPDVGVVLVTSANEKEASRASVELGVMGYLAKPIQLDELNRALQRAFLRRAADTHHRAMVSWMYDTMDKNAQAIREVTVGSLTSLTNALEARLVHFRGHSRAVALQAAALAETLGMGEADVEAVRIAGMLHDIGMIGVPDSVVEKPGSLTTEERSMIRSHCEAGVAIIQPLKHLGAAHRYVLEHHERWDGSGYPDQKREDEISLGGQVVGISEAWTAILESRPYREGWTRDRAMDILRKHQGEWFTSDVTEALIESDVGLM